MQEMISSGVHALCGDRARANPHDLGDITASGWGDTRTNQARHPDFALFA